MNSAIITGIDMANAAPVPANAEPPHANRHAIEYVFIGIPRGSR
jgi:hypothetical protein